MKKTVAVSILAISLLAAPISAFAQQHRGSHHGPTYSQKHVVKKPVVVKQQRWARNRVLPSQYRRNVVTDYRRYNLRAPARNQRWVQVDRQYLLINSLTGMVVALSAMR